jgi:hypothetical protein
MVSPMPVLSLVVSMRVLLAAIVVAGCATSNKKISNTAPAHSDASCPEVEPPKPDSAPPIIHIDDSNVARTPFVSLMIDGHWAAWNTRVLEAWKPQPFNPDPPLKPDEIDSIEVVKPALAERLYHSCPGVAVVVIRTKSGKWRPISPVGPRIDNPAPQAPKL